MKRYIITNKNNIPSFNTQILAQIARHYKATIIELWKDKDYQDKEIHLNSNLIVYPHISLTAAKARKRSNQNGGMSAIYHSTNHNYLEHVPTATRNVRCMVGLSDGPYAVLVEVQSDSKFRIRNLTSKMGYVCDLGLKFNGRSVTSTAPTSSVWGDLHNEVKDDLVFLKFLKHSKALKTKEIFLHDSFDGLSVNHHEMEKEFYHARKSIYNVTLVKELYNLANTFNFLSNHFKKINVVQSNHDYFLDRSIQNNEAVNKMNVADSILFYHLKAKLLSNIKDGVFESTLQVALNINNKLSKKIEFLDLVSITKRAEFTLSMHGDKGQNGSKFNFKSTTEPKTVTGHNHTGGYQNDNFSVGHCSDVSKQAYAHGGTSNWTNSLVDIYENGTAQLITFF
jgi:hypothetical protein